MSFIRGLVAHPEFRRLFRFGLTGVASFGTDFGTLVLAHDGFGWPLRASLVAAYTIGGIVHYSLTRWWVFPLEHGGGGAAEAGRVVRYLLLAAVNTAATLLIVPALAHVGVDYRLAKIICTALLFGLNYFVTPRFVMPREPRSPAPTEA